MPFAVWAVAVVLAAYLIGSVNFAVIFAQAFSHRDVRDYGSGNAGTTNVMRTVGVLPGILTFVCDVLKGFIACLAGLLVFRCAPDSATGWAHPIYGAYLCGVAAMLGHMFPVFFRFKGGKGVAISVGIFLVCSPKLVPIALGIFFLLALTTRIVSLSSLIAVIAVAVCTFVFYDRSALLWPQAVLSLTMCMMVYLKHIGNIKRLLRGEEKRLHFGRKS